MKPTESKRPPGSERQIVSTKPTEAKKPAADFKQEFKKTVKPEKASDAAAQKLRELFAADPDKWKVKPINKIKYSKKDTFRSTNSIKSPAASSRGKPAKPSKLSDSNRKLEVLLLSHPDQWRVEPSKKINKKNMVEKTMHNMYCRI
jgi:sarcosine oxidase gamma subunit